MSVMDNIPTFYVSKIKPGKWKVTNQSGSISAYYKTKREALEFINSLKNEVRLILYPAKS